MAYETGSALGSSDLLDKLRIFVAAQGWTINRWNAIGASHELCIQKSTAFFNFRSFNNEIPNICNINGSPTYGIGLNGSDSYSGGADWDRQPGYPELTGQPALLNQAQAYVPFVVNSGPFPSYHFFAVGTHAVYIEVEVATNSFIRFGFGSLDLFNAAAPGGGRFFYGVNTNSTITGDTTGYSWLTQGIDHGSYTQEEVPFRAADLNLPHYAIGSFLRAAFDSFNGWCTSSRFTANYRTGQSCHGGGVHDKILRDSAPNQINGIGFLTPCVISVNRNDTYLNPVGVMPGIRYMDMTNYLPGEEFTIGSDTWKVFPWYQKGGRSAERGIAYKKVV